MNDNTVAIMFYVFFAVDYKKPFGFRLIKTLFVFFFEIKHFMYNARVIINKRTNRARDFTLRIWFVVQWNTLFAVLKTQFI